MFSGYIINSYAYIINSYAWGVAQVINIPFVPPHRDYYSYNKKLLLLQ